MAKKLNYTYALGRRRSASARVRLFRGKGANTVNEKPIEEYFPGILDKMVWSKPFTVTQTSEKYYISARVVGGGKEGQVDAVAFATARAISGVKPDEYRSLLKKAGLLRRDSRIRERRKIGMGGQARRKKQSPKR